MAHNIVVIVGSLRKEAWSLKVANALAKLAPSSLKLDVTTLHGISFFNQDLEANVPADWLAFREKICCLLPVRQRPPTCSIHLRLHCRSEASDLT